MSARAFVIVTLVTFSVSASAQYPAALQQGAAAPKTAARAAAVLKAHYFAQDFVGGDEAGVELTRRFPRSAELRAWHVVNLSRVSGREADALALVDSTALWRPAPASTWRTFARSFAMSYHRDGDAKAIELAKRVRAATPWQRDAVWLHGYVLHRATKYAEVVALTDSVAKRQPLWGELLVLRANAFASQAGFPKADSVMRRRAKEAFAEARRVEPYNLNAIYLAAANLSDGPTDTASFAMLARTTSMTPALSVHQRYWSAVRARRDMKAEQKDSVIAQDVEALLAMRPSSPGVIRAAHDSYLAMKRNDKQQQLLARLRGEHPSSVELEWVEYNLLSEVRDSAANNPADSAAIMARWRQQVDELAARPVHKNSGIYGTLLLWQYDFRQAVDSTIRGDSLKRFGETLIKHNTANPRWTHVDLPLLVAERKGDFRWAEKVLLEGDSIRKAQVERMKESIVRQEGVGGYADFLEGNKATTHSGLGWIHMHEGRFDDAARELAKALELNRKDPRIHYHLGRLAEARGQPLEAQASYARGFPMEQFFTGYRNRDALKRMYAANNGSLDGFDGFVERLKEADRARRKQAIAEKRLADAPAMPAFALERYGGGANKSQLHSDSLKGKIAVVNFWGVWCGPCVKEIPDIQKFHETVKNDSNVVFVTVDYNDTPETLHEFMVKKKLDFPVVLDADRWASDKAGISSYPTTWFVDRDGRIAFKHIGASDFVLEEFLWRVEMLKAGAKP